MSRAYNFSAGPSTLPEPVLRRAAAELAEYGISGQSVMEMSHRSPEYEEIIFGCEALLRETLQIPEDYEVLFLQGGAWTQFSMVPMNLLTGSGKADYVITGQWAKKACGEAARYGDIAEAASSADRNFTYIPALSPSLFRSDADYAHICMNNTIFGTAYTDIPETGGIPLAADLSSCILSGPLDVSRFGLIYAGAQKNMGPAGVCTVIVRKDLLGRTLPGTPTMLDYAVHAKERSLFNTPPTYAIYICKLVLEWLRDEVGGLAAMREHNERKAALLYDFLDHAKLFHPTVQPPYRSIMNIPFITGSPDTDKAFLAQANRRGLLNLKGHRVVGGMRASLYNAMTLEGVQALVGFMREFEKQQG